MSLHQHVGYMPKSREVGWHLILEHGWANDHVIDTPDAELEEIHNRESHLDSSQVDVGQLDRVIALLDSARDTLSRAKALEPAQPPDEIYAFMPVYEAAGEAVRRLRDHRLKARHRMLYGEDEESRE